tara:strand:- start:1215 stop:1421 length:207 start_codon:yes stop_codon:yes gene_type:complete
MFIELTKIDYPVSSNQEEILMFNVEKISTIRPKEDGSIVFIRDMTFRVKESYDEIKGIIEMYNEKCFK